MVSHNAQPASANAQADDDLEAIRLLHSFCESPELIARKLHLPVADVRFAIKHGHFPQRQQQLAWVAEPTPDERGA